MCSRALLALLGLPLAPGLTSAQSGPDAPPARHGPPAGAREGNAGGKVTGIGGLFFRARDPESLSRWYLTHLGINLTPASYDQEPWRQEAGPTVFAPFPDTTDYFGSPQQAWMVNFRVRDLDAMAKQLKAAGIAVKVDPEVYPNGRFARLHDPEGNPIELWEPREPGAPR